LLWVYSACDRLKFLVTADWHMLDQVGANPPNIRTKEGNLISQSNLQKLTFEGAQKICKDIGKTDGAIIDGDLAAGKDPKQYGIPLSDADTDNQVEAAYQFYKETIYKYCNPDYAFITMGTPYHVLVGIGGNLDYQIALRISELTPVLFGYPNLNVYLGSDKLLWNIQHRMAVTKDPMGPLVRTFETYARLEMESLAGSMENIPTVICRAHIHKPQLPAPIAGGKRWFLCAPPLKHLGIYEGLLPYPTKASIGLMEVIQEKGSLQGKFYPIEIRKKEIEKI